MIDRWGDSGIPRNYYELAFTHRTYLGHDVYPLVNESSVVKKDGGIAAPLNHAFDQVRDWLNICDQHKLAVLECLKVDSSEVGAIKGAVIAGRDIGYDAHHLRNLKSNDYGPVSLHTYDDLLFALRTLISKIRSL